ncbi:MAG: hypothetical protein H0W55_14755, partial [Actinobacteria bacterium]|nr:hypothetical protein [Actinomycetota bacterium]
MSQSALTMDVRQPHEHASIIDISGDITAASEDELMEAYNKASSDRIRAIILNFDGLE